VKPKEDHHHISALVDACGLACPLPLLKAKLALSSAQPQQLVKVLATDRGSVRDFHSFVELTSHELVDFTESDGTFIFIIRKG